MITDEGRRRVATRALLAAVAVWGLCIAAPAAAEPVWGVGWEDGLTVRRTLGGVWELSLGAGPDDYLHKIEQQRWDLAMPPPQQGALEVPTDYREEEGWVRAQAGRRLVRRDDLALAAFAGLTYNWIDAQERVLLLDDLVGDYDTWERDRFTERWILAAGLRPSWRPTDFMSIEFSFGLRFVWESWSESTERTYAGVAGADRASREGHGRAFEDFGWEGMSSLQFFLWF